MLLFSQALNISNYISQCRSMFEKHRMVLLVRIALIVQRAEDILSSSEWRFLLTGQPDSKSALLHQAVDSSHWLTKPVMERLKLLVGLPCFEVSGVSLHWVLKQDKGTCFQHP